MRLYALSAGLDAPVDSFSGTIHSVFHRACNIQLENGALLTLLSPEHCNVPQGIRVDTSPAFAFLHHVPIGQPAACRGGILRVGASDLSIALRTATRWHVDLTELGIGLRRHDIAKMWEAAWVELKRHRRGDGLSAMMIETCSRDGLNRVAPVPTHSVPTQVRLKSHTIPALIIATRAAQVERVVTTMTSLVGMGPGLTPSGDDFIVGFLAGLWCTAGDDSGRLQFITSVGQSLAKALTGTNPISRSYIASAANGHVSEVITAVVQQLAQAVTFDGVQAATRAALQVGHTSGADGMLGVLLGLTVWTPSLSGLVGAEIGINGLSAGSRVSDDVNRAKRLVHSS